MTLLIVVGEGNVVIFETNFLGRASNFLVGDEYPPRENALQGGNIAN